MLNLMKYLIFIIFLSFNAYGQKNIVPNDSTGILDVSSHAQIYIAPNYKETIDSIQHKPFERFSKDKLYINSQKAIFWLKLSIQNPHHTRKTWYLNVGKFYFIDIYQLGNRPTKHTQGGTISDWDRLPDGYALPIELEAHEQATLFVRIGNQLIPEKNASIYPMLYTKKVYDESRFNLYSERTKLFTLYFITLGFLVCSIIIGLFQYFSFKDTAVMYYIAVLAISILAIVRIAEFHLDIRFISNLIPTFSLYTFTLHLIYNCVYNEFFVKMFNLAYTDNLRNNNRSWYLNIHRLFFVITVICIYISVQRRSIIPLGYSYSFVLVFFSFILVLTTIIRNTKFHKYNKYIVYGFLCMQLSNFISYFLAIVYAKFPLSQLHFYQLQPFYTCLGTIIEFTFFMTALNMRIKLIESNSILKGQEFERKRMADELQNNVNSLLASIKIAIQSIIPNPEQENIYQKLINMIDSATKEVRNISNDLVPAEIEKKGLKSSLGTLVMRLNIGNNIHFNLETSQYTIELKSEVSFQIYMICTELCQNIIKHSNANKAGIELEVSWENAPNSTQAKGNLFMYVWDNGKGFEKDKIEGGMGFKNIRHRAEVIGAEYKIISQDNGSTFFLKLPLNQSNHF